MPDFFDLKARRAAAATNGGAEQKQNKADDGRVQPWVEKYRPKSLDDVTAQEHTVNVLQRTLQAANLPHMLFYGPPGTGKTSTILALAKQLYGPAMMRSRVLELNASDERGISVVRDKVKNFARAQLTNPPADPAYRRRHPCPPFKLIVLDEADSMTHDAQSALRRTMELYSRVTRFCLVCNYVTRIIDPLASRCSKFRFKSLDSGSARRRLADIAAAERVALADAALDALVRCSDGDLRKAVTFLQGAARLVKSGGGGGGSSDAPAADADGDEPMDGHAVEESSAAEAVTVQIVEDIAGVVPGRTIDDLVAAIRPRGSSSSYAAVSKVVDDLVADGWSANQVILQLYQVIVYDETIPDVQKNKIVLVFSEVDKRLLDGADEHLSILDLSLRISAIMAQK